MIECYNPYTLPTLSFVGGETQSLLFNVYYSKNMEPFSMVGCISNFSVVNFTNKNGSPIIRKDMTVIENHDGTALNVLSVNLDPRDTYELHGKFIYQISIRDIDGNVEIPQQGIMYITNNINKSFINNDLR